MGDGINDAPALHAADVGISVDGAADVARAAADLILLEHDLSVVQDAVICGRSTVQNVSKYVLMGSSSNFGNMFSMAGAALFLPFLPMLPIQILLNNLLYDVSEIAIPFDRVDEEAVAGPVKWDVRFIERFMLVFGPVSSVFDFLTFYVLLYLFGAGEALFQTGWFIESITTQVLVVFAIRTRRSVFRSRPHVFLVAMALGVIAVAIALPLLSIGGWLGFVVAAAAVLRFPDRRDIGISCDRGDHQARFLPRHGCTITSSRNNRSHHRPEQGSDACGTRGGCTPERDVYCARHYVCAAGARRQCPQ